MEPTEGRTTLVIRITHAQPIEMSDFASSMSAFGNLFSEFCSQHGTSKEARKAKLYLEKVEHGSIEMHLVEIFTAGLLPFMDNTNIIIDFAQYLKLIYDYFANSKGKKPKLNEAECREAKKSLDIVAKDNSGEMNIYAVNDHSETHYHNCTVYQINGNAAQNKLDREAEQIKEDKCGIETRKNVLMTIYQMRTDLSQKTGNVARIDEISDRKVAVQFDNTDLKERIIGSAENPVRQCYLVDVEVKTAEGKVALYIVTDLHEIVPLDV